MHSANRMAAANCMMSSRYRSRASVNAYVKRENAGTKCDPTDFNRGIVVGARCSRLGISEQQYLDLTQNGTRDSLGCMKVLSLLTS